MYQYGSMNANKWNKIKKIQIENNDLIQNCSWSIGKRYNMRAPVLIHFGSLFVIKYFCYFLFASTRKNS